MAEQQEIKRIMPHSTEAEMSVVGAMLMDQQAIGKAMEVLSADDFYSRQYGIMFETMAELDREGMAVDPVTVQQRLKEKNLPPEMYDPQTLGTLIAQVPTSANILSYARIVADKSMLRRLIRVNEELAQTAYAESEDPEILMRKAEEDIFRLAQKRNSSDFVPIGEIVLKAIDKIVAASKIHGSVTGVATGFVDLDSRTGGLPARGPDPSRSKAFHGKNGARAEYRAECRRKERQACRNILPRNVKGTADEPSVCHGEPCGFPEDPHRRPDGR